MADAQTEVRELVAELEMIATEGMCSADDPIRQAAAMLTRLSTPSWSEDDVERVGWVIKDAFGAAPMEKALRDKLARAAITALRSAKIIRLSGNLQKTQNALLKEPPVASDIVERLLANAAMVRDDVFQADPVLIDEAAAHIESQDAALRKAREDLVKIAKIVRSNRTVGARLARIDALARATLSTLNELLDSDNGK